MVGKPRRQPGLLHREESYGFACEIPLPPIGAAWRMSWSADAGAPEAAAAAGEPELLMVRVGDDSFRAILVFDEVSESDDGSGDQAANGDAGSGATAGSGSGSPGGSSQEPPASGSGESRQRRIWARWFAAQVPGRPELRPDSREDLREMLERVLGERKTRYLAAASRELNAREAARLLDQVRRWVLDQRG
jgi:hypothetical protein